MKREKTIPTILGLVILLIGTVFGITATTKTTFFSQKASGTCDPQNLRITNISHYSVNISFTTSANCLSSLFTDNRTFFDIRYTNLGLSPRPSKIHYFEVDNLKANSKYPFHFIIDSKKYQKEEYNFSTASKPNKSVPSSNLAWGRVFNKDLTPASNSIVFLHIPGGSDLSSFVTSNGYWNVSLATSFNDSLNDWFIPPEKIEEDILVLSDDGSVTQIVGNTARNNPVPDIIIGQNYFPEEPVDYKPAVGGSPQDDNKTLNRSLSVINPKESEVINTLKPDVFGYAPSNSNITITYKNQNYYVNSSSDGSWHWYPSNNLDVGPNQIKVINNSQTIIRNFTVDTNLGMAFTATPSATTITPTPTPTLTPTPTPTPTPTLTPTPSEIVRTSKPSTQSGVPVSGTSAPTIILIVASIIFGFFFYITKKTEK